MSYSVTKLDCTEWPEDGFPLPRKAYTASDDEASTIVKLVYTREQYDAAAAEVRETSREPEIGDIIATLCPLRTRYGGPGRPFAHEPCIRIGKRQVVVTQFAGLDI